LETSVMTLVDLSHDFADGTPGFVSGGMDK
jgi:hypothetical protein